MSLPLARYACRFRVSQFDARQFREKRKGNDMDSFVGLDVSLASKTICVLSGMRPVFRIVMAEFERAADAGRFAVVTPSRSVANRWRRDTRHRTDR